MKKKRTAVMLMIAILLVCLMPATVWAAGKVVYVGKSYKINVAGKYKWSSMNKKIAKVDSKKKKIIPLRTGTTYVKGVKKTKHKTIVKRIKIVVKAPYINKKKATITAGKKLQLKLTGTTAVRWTTSSKKTATVTSRGVVRGIRAGTVKITGKGKNGKKYTCVIKVKAAKTPAKPTATPTVAPTATPTPTPEPTEAPKNYTAYMIAHRGDMTTAPENTISAFKMAIAKGYKAVETDVQFTKDNVPVLLHSATIDRTSNGNGRIADMTFDEVRQYDFGSWKSAEYEGEKIPSFQEFIEFCKENSIHPYIELKEETIADTDIEKVQMLYKIVCAAGMQHKVSWFSFGYEQMVMMKEIDPTADIGIVLHNYKNNILTDDWIEKLSRLETGANTVFVSDFARRITPLMLEKCRERKIQLIARDIKNIQELHDLDLYYKAAFADGM